MTALAFVVLGVAACGRGATERPQTPSSTPTTLPTGAGTGLSTTTSGEPATSGPTTSRAKGTGLGAAPQALTPAETIPATPGEADGDVTVTRCAAEGAERNSPGGATLKVVNHSAVRSSYAIWVGFTTPDGKTQMDYGLASTGPIDPGQTTSTVALTATDFTGTPFTCSVLRVERDAA